MLVLTRRKDEAIVLQFPGGDVVVKVLSVQGGRVKLGVEAPDSVTVQRPESVKPPRAA